MYSPNLNTLMNLLLQTGQQTQSEEVDDLPFSLFPKGLKRTKKTKVLLVSSHCHQYNSNSKVSWNLLKLLSAEHSLEVQHYGIMQAKRANIDFRHYPANIKYYSAGELTEDPLGLTELGSVIASFEPDCVVLYNKLPIIKKYVEKLKGCFFGLTVGYIEMSYFSIGKEIKTMLNDGLSHIFVRSEFWKKNLESQGISKPISVCEYGVDVNCFPVLDKAKARESLRLPQDSFLVLCPNKNLHKYRYDIIICAFVKLIAKYPDRSIHIFCLCESGIGEGYPILDIYRTELRKYNVGYDAHLGKLLLASQDQHYSDSIINKIYNCADIGISIPDSEGGHLSTLELMGLGVPVISVGSEDLPIKHRYYVTNSISECPGEAGAVEVEDVFQAMERYLLNPVAKKADCLDWATAATNLINYLKEL